MSGLRQAPPMLVAIKFMPIAVPQMMNVLRTTFSLGLIVSYTVKIQMSTKNMVARI